MIINNSININKRNSPQNILSTKKTMTYDVGNPGPGLEQAQKCDGVKPVNEIPTLPLLMLCTCVIV
jgi:hypothetical protein